MTHRYLYAVASGHNSVIGEVNFEDVMKAAGDIYPDSAPNAVAKANFGQREVVGDASIFLRGYRKQGWAVRPCGLYLPGYIMDTFCNGGIWGFVTVHTRFGRAEYSDWNATMVLPDPDSMRRSEGVATYDEYLITFIDMTPV